MFSRSFRKTERRNKERKIEIIVGKKKVTMVEKGKIRNRRKSWSIKECSGKEVVERVTIAEQRKSSKR